MSIAALIILGVLVGTFGTLIGAGGGFILVPIMLLLYPERSAELITSISLAVVCLNAASGSIAYAFKKRIDYKSAFLFALTTLPGSVIGAYVTRFIPRDVFNILFGVLLLILSGVLIWKPLRKVEEHHALKQYRFGIKRTITDSNGTVHTYSYNLATALGLSFFVGIASSMLGIGGGIIHVPAMVNLLNFPVHLATATSHFLLTWMALAGSVVHLMEGTLQEGLKEVLFLGIGVIVGAQVGAALSHKVKDATIVRSLAVALGIVALRILWGAFA